MSREQDRLRAALVEAGQLVAQALRDVELMKVELECVAGEVRDALDPPVPADPVGIPVRRRP